MSVRLGFLLQGRWEPGQIYSGTVEVFRGAESLGVETGWLAQHHFEAGHTPSPLILLSAVAGRTDRIGLGTATIILPFENPLRLAEDATTLAQIAPGRLQLGVGSGFGLAYNTAAARIDALYGVDSGNRTEYSEAILHRLLHALTGEPVDKEHDLFLEPSPGALRQHVWRATSSPHTAAGAGDLDLGLLVSSNASPIRARTDDTQLDLIRAYHASGIAQPRVGVLRNVRIGTSARTLEAELLAEHRGRIDTHVASGGLPPGLSTEDYLNRLSIHYGDGRRAADSLRAERTWPVTTELIVLFSGQLHAATILHTLEQLLDGLHN